MPVIEKENPKLSLIEHLIIGGISTATSKTFNAPVERIKLLLQCQGEMIKQDTISRPYISAFDCAKRINKNEGLISFWRGNLASCIRYFPTQIFEFAFKDQIKGTFKQNKEDSYLVNFSKNVVSGGVAGSLSLCLVYSLDYARTRLATDVKSTKNGDSQRKFHGLADVYKKTLTTDGIVGLYRGFVISCVGIFIYRGFYFGLYDTLKPVLISSDGNITHSFLLAYGVTLTSNFISYPFDTIRRRMMLTSGQSIKYNGSLDCFFSIIRTEGVTALYKGFILSLLTGGIIGAGLLAGYDKLAQNHTDVKSDTSGGS